MSARISVLLFGPLRALLGSSLTVELPSLPISVDCVLEELAANHEQIAAMRPHLRIAVNQAFANGDLLVHAGDDVALIPPVSGG